MTKIQGIPHLGDGVRLHLNENTGGCSPTVVEAVRGLTREAWRPIPDYRAAVTETAAFLGVDPEWLVLTNGLDEGVLLAAIGYLGPRAPEALVEGGRVVRRGRAANAKSSSPHPRSKPTSRRRKHWVRASSPCRQGRATRFRSTAC